MPSPLFRGDAKAESNMTRDWLALVWMVLCLWPSMVAAQERRYEWEWGMHPMWGVWGIGMMLMMLVFWGAVIVGMVVAIRWLVSQGQGKEPRRTDAAVDILRQRYARGEINKEEFEAKRRDLT